MVVNILCRDKLVPYEATAFSIQEPLYDTSVSEHKIYRQISKTFCQAIEFYNSHPYYKTIPFQSFMVCLQLAN